jgi:thiol-disulfide isomerase/thioredoxin
MKNFGDLPRDTRIEKA